MTEFKGTKGKWWLSIGFNVYGKGLEQIYSSSKKPTKEEKANALLISKAPEMLEMLQRIMKTYDKGTQTYLDCQQLIKQATEL